MHIPDGYLSPATCAIFYAASAPVLLVALRRLNRQLNARMVPLLSLCAAFSFVIMMFNLPLPGGTTGHAVGVGLAAVVLGPWASTVAISIALLIQAVFFGDGGITSLGANIFNMAIVGSFVAAGVYRVVSGNSAITSRRRMIAAGLAGYLALNISALCAAVEFGVQPMFFHDAHGAPLYAPYPLHVAIPAMMLGHLAIAGLAELVLSAGIVSWLQKAEPTLLSAPWSTGSMPSEKMLPDFAFGSKITRQMLAALAALMIATPLGLLAAGTAWGEWGGEDFADPAMRKEIAKVSMQTPAPEGTPSGMERLSTVWTSPVPDYAPGFLKSASFGYILSAVFGSGVILIVCLAGGSVAAWCQRPRQTAA